ncbi:unnamed protein product [Ectocarpus sp. CCAP 1310/34]|nr:unnamed protein product [Ectocarpus sp. CCAP 1310/34]
MLGSVLQLTRLWQPFPAKATCCRTPYEAFLQGAPASVASAVFDPSTEYCTPDMVFFWKPPSPFSQWTPSTFTVDGVVYSCAEQFFAAEKARLFRDRCALQNIMRVSDPALHIKFGREVRGFDQSLWEQERENIVLTGCYTKFSQNSELRNHLLGSGGKILAEASPYDRVWGIGLQVYHPDAGCTSRWRGLNLLGTALQKMEVTNFAMQANISFNFTQSIASFSSSWRRTRHVSPLSRPPVAKQVDAILDQYLAAGLIQHSTSPYSSPLVVIPRKSGGVHITVIYRRLNKLCALSQLPIPRVDDTLDKLLKGRTYSLFDMKSSFHQITVHRDTTPLTAFVTSSGLFEWLKMPQGSSAAPGWFRKVVNEVIKNLQGVASYLDDLIVFDDTPYSYFLGHTISPDGVRPIGAKVSALTKMPMPRDVKQLRSLLGGLSYYRKFPPNMAKRIRPLTTLLKKQEKFIFTPSMEQAVRDLLAELANPPVLVYPDWDAVSDGSRPFYLYCDASRDGFGGTLEQEQPDGSIRPIVFISRATLDSESHWTPLDLEAGSIVWCIKRLRGYLWDLFSRRADMYAVTAAEFTTEGTADILVDRAFCALLGSVRWTCSIPSRTFSGTGQVRLTKIAKQIAVIVRCALEPLPGNWRVLKVRELCLRATRLSRSTWDRRFANTPLPVGAFFWYKTQDGLWWLGKISGPPLPSDFYVVRFLDDPGSVKLALPDVRYSTVETAVSGSWCFQVHSGSALFKGVLRNIDMSRGDVVTASLSDDIARPH